MYAALPKDEANRLRALQSYQIMDTAPEADYDELVNLASRLMDTPTALISLVDEERQWFKANKGLDTRETARTYAFCAHAILGDEPFVVEDARQDVRFKFNPLVLDAPRIVSYAGAPLKTPEGRRLGTLCVIDKKPRRFSKAELHLLEQLARQVMVLMNQRRNSIRLEHALLMRQTTEKDQNRLRELIRLHMLEPLQSHQLRLTTTGRPPSAEDLDALIEACRRSLNNEEPSTAEHTPDAPS